MSRLTLKAKAARKWHAAQVRRMVRIMFPGHSRAQPGGPVWGHAQRHVERKRKADAAFRRAERAMRAFGAAFRVSSAALSGLRAALPQFGCMCVGGLAGVRRYHSDGVAAMLPPEHVPRMLERSTETLRPPPPILHPHEVPVRISTGLQLRGGMIYRVERYGTRTLLGKITDAEFGLG